MDRLNKLIKKTNLPVYLLDERLTSRAADSMLKNMGLNRRQRNERDDMVAASMILETALESVKKLWFSLKTRILLYILHTFYISFLDSKEITMYLFPEN